jgi:homogentisate 1,2-dioxygenase
MNEFMGLVTGEYDAKAGGFVPGGISLHGMMSAHGPDNTTTERAMAADLAPHKVDKTLAFMFETSRVLLASEFAMACPQLQTDYDACWSGMKRHYAG